MHYYPQCLVEAHWWIDCWQSLFLPRMGSLNEREVSGEPQPKAWSEGGARRNRDCGQPWRSWISRSSSNGKFPLAETFDWHRYWFPGGYIEFRFLLGLTAVVYNKACDSLLEKCYTAILEYIFSQRRANHSDQSLARRKRRLGSIADWLRKSAILAGQDPELFLSCHLCEV